MGGKFLIIWRVVSYYLVAYFVTEATTRGVLLKKVFLKFWQNSQENTSVRVSFLKKLQALGLQLYQNWHYEFCEIFENKLLKNTSDGCFLSIFASVFRTPTFYKSCFETLNFSNIFSIQYLLIKFGRSALTHSNDLVVLHKKTLRVYL